MTEKENELLTDERGRRSDTLSTSNIPDLIDLVDREFSQWKRFSTLWIWLIVTSLLLVLGFVGIESYSDLGVRIALSAAIFAVVLASLQIISASIISWIATANYLAIKKSVGLKKGEQDLLLCALVFMKAVQPSMKLSDAH